LKNLIIFAHPYSESYNSAILKNIVDELKRRKQSVDVLDLYKEKFNPVLGEGELALYIEGQYLDPKVKEYQKRIDSADHLIFIFPVWWYDLPAILKVFLDKVLLKNWAYELTKSGLPKGKLGFIKKTTVISTMKSPNWYYRLLYKSSIKYSFIKGTLNFCGIKNVQWINITNIESIGDQKRKKWLKKIRKWDL
jgi:putative NADPH-quinone reductase